MDTTNIVNDFLTRRNKAHEQLHRSPPPNAVVVVISNHKAMELFTHWHQHESPTPWWPTLDNTSILSLNMLCLWISEQTGLHTNFVLNDGDKPVTLFFNVSEDLAVQTKLTWG